MGQAYVGITLKGVPLQCGLLSFTDPVDNGNGTITIPTLKGNFDSDAAGVYAGNIVTKTIPAGTTGAGGIPAIPDNGVSYICADYNGGNPVWTVIADTSLIGPRMLSYATIYREGTYLNWIGWDSMGLGLAEKISERHIRTERFSYESGLVVTANGAKNVFCTSGYIWTGPVRKQIASFDSTVNAIKWWYHVAGVWANSDSAIYINDRYDNGTNVVTLDNNKWTVNWVYRSAGYTGRCVIILGGQYTSYAEAVAALEPTKPPATSALGVLTARIVVQKGSTSPTILSAFSTPIGTTSTSDHESLGGLLGGAASNHYHFAYYATVAAAQAAVGGTDGSSVCFVKETQQFYYWSAASGTTVDGFMALSTGDGGNTRWITYDPTNDGGGIPCGVQNSAGWTLAYNPGTRQVTATPSGTQYIWVNGKRFAYSTPQVVTHGVTTPNDYFIFVNSSGVFTSDFNPWDIASSSAALIAFVRYDTAMTPAGYCLTELHASKRNPAAHKNLHESQGTYRVSGGAVSGLTAYLITDATNPALSTINPDVSSIVIADEDLRSTLDAFTQGAVGYAKFRKLHTTNKWAWDVSDLDAPYFQTANVPQYNPASSGDSLAAMTDLAHAVWWLFALPTNTAAGQFRFIWVSPQYQYVAASSSNANRTSALSSALAEDWRGLDLSGLPPEYAPVWRVTCEYRTGYTNNAYRLRVSDSRIVTGSRSATGSFSGVSPTIHNNLSGRSDPSAHPDSSVDTTSTFAGGLVSATETTVALALARLSEFGFLGDWATGKAYRIGNLVRNAGATYRAVTAHTAAAAWLTDIAKWEQVAPAIVTTVAIAETLSANDNDMMYCVENETWYRYETAGSSFTDDNLWVLSTGAGGNTRWLGVAGKYNLSRKLSESGLSIAAGGSINLSSAVGSERSYTVIGDALGQNAMSPTPFTSTATPPAEPMTVWLIGLNNTYTVTLSTNDAAQGALIAGGFIELGRGTAICLKYSQAMARWIEIARNNATF